MIELRNGFCVTPFEEPDAYCCYFVERGFMEMLVKVVTLPPDIYNSTNPEKSPDDSVFIR